jgi:hypothetical protein
VRLAWIVLFALGCQSSNVSRQLGARCDMNSECDSRCLMPGGDWPGGFCTVACDSAAACPDGASCISESGGVCAFACGGVADCAFLGTGYSCKQVDAQGGGVKVTVCHGG